MASKKQSPKLVRDAAEFYDEVSTKVTIALMLGRFITTQTDDMLGLVDDVYREWIELKAQHSVLPKDSTTVELWITHSIMPTLEQTHQVLQRFPSLKYVTAIHHH